MCLCALAILIARLGHNSQHNFWRLLTQFKEKNIVWNVIFEEGEKN